MRHVLPFVLLVVVAVAAYATGIALLSGVVLDVGAPLSRAGLEFAGIMHGAGETIAALLPIVAAVLVALGVKEAAAAALRRLGIIAVERAKATPDKRDDERAAVAAAAFNAIARKLDGGEGEQAARAAALAEFVAARLATATPQDIAAIRSVIDRERADDEATR